MIAAEVSSSLPVEVTALAILGAVVLYFLRRSERDESRRDREDQADRLRAAELEEKLYHCQQELGEQRRGKHDALNRQAAAQGRVTLAREFARNCTCAAREPLLRVLEDH